METKPSYEELEQRVWELKKEALENKQTEHSLVKINACLLNLGSYFTENVNRITSLSGELFGATCALYNRLDGGMLCSIGQWQTPPDYNPVDKPDGHICYDVIQRGVDDVFVVQDLQNSIYAQSDPNVVHYNLETYVGHPVNCGGQYIGSLCVVFKSDYFPDEKEKMIIGILASAISEEENRKQAEEALRESEERFRNVYGTAPLAFVVWDIDARVTDWNKKAEEVFGWTKEEVVGYNFFNFLIPKKDRPHVADIWDRLISGEFQSHSINDNLTKEGKIITCEWNNSPLHDSDGNIIGAISLGLDITERKRVEKDRERLITALQEALKEIKTLRGILPLCSFCKKIRNDKGYWEQVDVYIDKHLQAGISHSICPDCAKEHYSDLDI